MKRIFFLLTLLIFFSCASVSFAMENYFKSTDFSFSTLKNVNIYFIAYERVLTKNIPGFVQHRIPEPVVLDCLKKQKGSVHILSGQGMKDYIDADLQVEIYKLGTLDGISSAEMEFILRDRKHHNVVYRRRFARTGHGSCDVLIQQVCDEFYLDLQ